MARKTAEEWSKEYIKLCSGQGIPYPSYLIVEGMVPEILAQGREEGAREALRVDDELNGSGERKLAYTNKVTNTVLANLKARDAEPVKEKSNE